MFIRRKIVRGTTYYSLVKNQRVDGRVRQITVVSMGQCSTIDAAIEAARKEAKYRRETVRQYTKKEVARSFDGRILLDSDRYPILIDYLQSPGKFAQKQAIQAESRLQVLLKARDVVLQNSTKTCKVVAPH